MAKIDEPRLKAELKAGKLSRVYFLFGEEDFLIKMYTDKIIAAALGDEPSDMNFVKYKGNPKSDELIDHTDSLPFFAEYKVVLITDLEPDNMESSEVNAYEALVEELPDTTVLIFSETGVKVDYKKPKAKMKKLIAAVEKAGVVCELNYMSAAQIATLAEKKATRLGCALSRDNGLYLAELCGMSLSSVSTEVEKLCAYTGSGEITREAIEKLTPRHIDTSLYTLAGELFAGRTAGAFRILDDLFVQRIDPVTILATLSGYFVDLYRAKLGKAVKASYSETASAFKYPPHRSFVMRNAYSTVNKLSEGYLAACVDILYNTNKLMNSSKADKRTLIEEALTRISMLERG